MIHINVHSSPGRVRALHGVNLGPTDRHFAFDFTEHYRKAHIPSVRTHDCNRSAMDVVDLHYIFPDPMADPDDERNYRFALTDDYLQTIRNAGCEIYFRLGESIEGRLPRKIYVVGKRWNPKILARVCTNIARHYNHGWANGFAWGIRHWQFWNEPNNMFTAPPEQRPCWTGTADEFYALYLAVATEMKASDPTLKVGLAGFGRPYFIFPQGHPFYVEENPWRHLEPLLSCGPVDSVSWHQYGASWEDLALTARQVRDCLDANGLGQAENHITEWNYLPKLEDERGVFTWFNARAEKDYDRLDRVNEVMGGVEGAAYVFGALARLQDAPVDLTHLYTGVTSGALGLFNPHGRPRKKFTSLEVFAGFLEQTRVQVSGGVPDRVTALASLQDGILQIGIAHLKPERAELELRLEATGFSLQSARQFLDSGWREISAPLSRQGADCMVTLPVGGSGLTILTGTLSPGG